MADIVLGDASKGYENGVMVSKTDLRRKKCWILLQMFLKAKAMS